MRALLIVGLPALLVCLSEWKRGAVDPGVFGTTEGAGTRGEVCATGCAAIPPNERRLSESEFRRLVAELAAGPLEGSAALDALLFHGERTLEWIRSLGLGALGPERADVLLRELRRDHALLEVRVVDEAGRERLRLGQRRVPLGVKQHLVPERVLGIQPPEVSGTLERVGRKHLWARL